MTTVSCPRCASEVPIPTTGAGSPVAVTCPGCASRLEMSIVSDGAETLFQPQLLTDSAAAPTVDPAATVAVGSGTVRLEASAAVEQAPATVVQAALILAGAEPGSERFQLTSATTTVGREAADLTIADPAMSSRHFEIEVRGGEYFVRDLGSSNGTFLNGQPVRAAELVAGDTLQAGQTRWTFRTFEALAIEPPD